jgi:hypothetical protein
VCRYAIPWHPLLAACFDRSTFRANIMNVSKYINKQEVERKEEKKDKWNEG